MGVIFTRDQEPSWVFSSPAGPVPPRSRVRRVLRPGPIPLTRPGWLRPDLDIGEAAALGGAAEVPVVLLLQVLEVPGLEKGPEGLLVLHLVHRHVLVLVLAH